MLITNFASGELSPNLNGRVDLGQYYQGAARIENFDIIPTGGIKRRVGTKRLAEAGEECRLIPFILDKNTIFIFQLYAFNLKIWKLNSDGTLTVTQTISYTQAMVQPTEDNFNEGVWYKLVNEDYVRATTYESGVTYYYNYADFVSLAECREIQFAQNYDTIILCTKTHNPVILKYNFSTHLFDCSYMYFDFTPDVTIDDDYDFVMQAVLSLPTCTKTPTSNGYYEFTYYEKTGNSSVLRTKTYSPGITDVYCIYGNKLYKYSGSSWVSYGKDYDQDKTLFTTLNKYPGCVTFFNNRLWLSSTIAKRQKIWASALPDEDNGEYNKFTTYKKYITVNKVIREADLHLFTCDINSADVNIGDHTTVLRNVTQDFTITGILKKSAQLYYITGDGIPVGTKVVSVTADTITINTDAINIPDEGITNLVCSIQLWRDASNPGAEDYDYQIVNSNIVTADCSFNFELASDENDAIMFMASNQFLSIGTENSIWSVAAGSNALSVLAEMQGRYGSDDLQGLTVAQATIYFAQGRKGIREYYYDSAAEAFRTNDIAILADHILHESKVTDFDYISNPYNRLVITREDGKVCNLLYDKNNGIMAWNRNTRTHGKYINVAVTRGDDEYDLIFFLVKDGEKYFIEMQDNLQEVYLDSWKLYEDTEDYNNDKAILWNKTKSTTCKINQIPEDFIEEDDEVYIGYPIISYIKSMPVLSNDPTGRKRITSLQLRFLNSYMPVVKCPGLSDEHFYNVTPPFSGVKEVTYPGVTERDVTFELEADGVDPVNILTVNAKTA